MKLTQSRSENQPVIRRFLLKAYPALLSPAFLPSPALASAETPVMRVYRRWKAEIDLLDGPVARALTDEALSARLDVANQIEEEMERTTAQSTADLSAKVLCVSDFGDFALARAVMTECEAIMAGVL